MKIERLLATVKMYEKLSYRGKKESNDRQKKERKTRRKEERKKKGEKEWREEGKKEKWAKKDRRDHS